MTEADGVRAHLAKRLKLPAFTDGASLVAEISKRQSLHDKCVDQGFELDLILKSAGIVSPKNVFINWYQFDNIDVMTSKDVVRYFDDLWYPSSDDIDLFDSSFAWVVSVRHDGIVAIVKF